MVPLCDGGLQESEGRVSALHGWQTQTHRSAHFHTHIACVEGIRVMTVRINFSIRLLGASYLAPSHRHAHKDSYIEAVPLGSCLSLLESHLRGANTLMVETRAY